MSLLQVKSEMLFQIVPGNTKCEFWVVKVKQVSKIWKDFVTKYYNYSKVLTFAIKAQSYSY